MMYTVFAESQAGPGGNPASVVLDAGHLSASEKQGLALENGAPTTVFVAAELDSPEPGLTLDFFTRTAEIAMCGHATVAAVTALVDAGRLDPGRGLSLALTTKSFGSTIWVSAGAAERPSVEIGLAAARFRDEDRAAQLDRGRIESVLGGVPTDVTLPLLVGHAGLWHVFVAFPSIADLARLDPRWEALIALCRELRVDTLAAFASTPDADGCYHMRDLCGGIGNREEPASGTTSGALVAYLVRSGRLSGSDTLEVDVRMGIEMGRPSRVRVRRKLGADGTPRLSVSGSARAIDKVAI